jgi:GTP cyclohydrolase III
MVGSGLAGRTPVEAQATCSDSCGESGADRDGERGADRDNLDSAAAALPVTS